MITFVIDRVITFVMVPFVKTEPAMSSDPLDHAHKFLSYDLLTHEREITRRHVVTHGKRIYRALYVGQKFDRWHFKYALQIAKREIAIAAFIPADQVVECVVRFRLSSSQPMGKQWTGRCYAALANAISNVHRHCPEFFLVPMKPTENSEQIEALLKAWSEWQGQQTFVQAAE